jgi:hypothetical protein
MQLCPAFVTTTNLRKRKSTMTGKQKLQLLAHQQWVDSMKKGMTKDKKVLDKLWKTEYTNNMVVDRSAMQKSGLVSGACAKPEEKVYTGTKLLGIATMHKSNMVPVFKAEDAADIASMRR